MITMEVVFWILATAILYAYLGYPALIIALGKLKGRLRQGKGLSPGPYEPSATLLVACFNEAPWLARKVENALQLDYPEEKLKIIVCNDGSDDGSAAILEKFPRVIHLHAPERRGKMAAINQAMQSVDTELVIFSDANAMLNREAVREMVRSFRDPGVGCVCGEKRLFLDGADEAASAGEGVYWRYESRVKAAEARLGSCIGAAGELFAIRTTLFREAAQDTLLDDFVISMGIALRGYRIQYTAAAYAMETASTGIKQEFKRKTRIAAGGLQAVLRLPGLLNPFRHGMLAFQYLSHKFLRSFVVPLCFTALIPLNLALLSAGDPVYIALFAMQMLFYLAAGAGYLLRDRRLHSHLFFVPFYVVVMNLAALAGLLRYVRRAQPVLWEKALRREASSGKEGTGPC